MPSGRGGATVEVADDELVETRFRAVLDALFAFVGLFSPDGIVLDTNQAPLTAGGLQRSDVVGHRFVDLPWFSHSEIERARVSEAIARAARGESSRFETSVRSTRGGIVAIDAAFAPLSPATGPIRRVVGTGVDISIRRKAEDELRRSSERLAESQRLAQLGSWEWNVVTDQVTWSEEMYRIYGVDRATHVPTYASFLRSLHPDDRGHTQGELRSAIDRRSSFEFEQRVFRPDGEIRMLHTRGEVVPGSDGGVARVIGSSWDVTERWHTSQAVEAARAAAEKSAAELRALAERLSEIREEERRELARELHDQVGQALTALKLDLAGVRGRLAAATPADTAGRLASLETLLDQTLETTRRISAALRPAILDDLGLAAAVAWQAAGFTQRTGVPCETALAPGEATFPDPVALGLFRILQEALTNVARHAGARRVRIELAADGEMAWLVVADDGRGFAAADVARKASLGLVGMRERALALGGQLELAGEPGRGTTVSARVPLRGGRPA